MKTKWKIVASIVLIALGLGYVVWNIWFSTTRIAFVNYQVITLGEIAKSKDHSRISLSSLDVEELDAAGKYDMILVNGMGLRINAEQRTELEKAAENGTPIITTMATNPANDITSIDSVTAATIKGYLNGGGRKNYRNMLIYIRRNVDGKTIDSETPDVPVKREQKLLYHIDPTAPDDEEFDFGSVAEYQAFLKKHNLLQENASAIIITGQMGEPTELIARLEQTGNAVYPVRDIQKLIQGNHIDSIRPAAVINMAHGRIGDYMVDYLNRQNIPLFSPLNINRLVEEWEADKMGMNGGFMSQSIVMPEIDGAIRPYALFGHHLNDDGMQEVSAIPERLEKFVETVNNHIKLKSKPNSEKRIVIYYYKGPGQNALTAAGMEVAPSLYNLLTRLKSEGYRVENMPASAAELNKLIQRQGSVFNAYANGAKADFLKNGNPELISAEQYAGWTTKAVRPQLMADVVAIDGEFPGSYISTEDGRLALPRVDLGNVVLLPQLAAGAGDDDFAIVHGTDAAPPHAYIASYLWARYEFDADVMIHFGTHGSLEFTPKKQVALSSNDWADILVGTVPHLYIYSIGDVGEGIIAKRRSYATLQSHLTPPFMESNVRGIYKELSTAIQEYNNLLYADGKPNTDKAALKVKHLTVELGIHRELRLDSLMDTPYTEQEISRIETFAEELANEKVTGELYTIGEPYSTERILSSVYAMSTEPIAYSLLALDKMRGKATDDLEKHKSLFTRLYLTPARDLVTHLLNGDMRTSDAVICTIAGITEDELYKAREIERTLSAPQDMMARMAVMQASTGGTMKHPAGAVKSGGGGHPESKTDTGNKTANQQSARQATMGGGKQYTKEEKEYARVIMKVERTIRNVDNYKTALENSPEAEFISLINAMNGGYTAPSPGGDPIANTNAIPTGRNLYAVNAEATPTELSWERGKELAENTIRMYRERHNDSIPRKVSYTLWSGEFIETEGATIAQILYMLGVEPIRDAFGRVNDIRLIPSEQLGRPRIDVVVQTSGQLRDIAASRLFLISRAVEMAAASRDDIYENFVSQSVADAERSLIEKGLSPKDAREVSTYRVFGGVNGNYGTGITNMVQSGDRWENSSEIADIYLQNMGAFYGSEKAWEQVQQFALEAALTNTDAVIQPRQSNTWGALSLDHVYEFMGGMNLAVRNVTGKEPDAYMSDYRNHNNMRMQELKEAIGVESRTTIFNPTYIQEKMKGGPSAAAGFAEIIQNTYGWNVTKPEVIDNEMWDEVYNIYVEDKFNLDVRNYFEDQNPAALEEMTAVMMETARKGMWEASAEQLAAIARLHTELVEKHKPSCSGHVCNNAKLQEFIASQVSSDMARNYKQNIREIKEASLSDDKSMVLKREELNSSDKVTTIISNTVVAALAVLAIVVFVLVVHRRRKKMEE
ncbi:MAG: cobaltochelatase subunit CobN [Candidatus Limimorpha sp.]